MAKGRLWSRLLLLTLMVTGVAMVSGCSIAGKRRTANGWQMSLVNGRGFEDGDGKYILAIYDGNLPEENSVSVLQLWSGPRKSED